MKNKKYPPAVGTLQKRLFFIPIPTPRCRRRTTEGAPNNDDFLTVRIGARQASGALRSSPWVLYPAPGQLFVTRGGIRRMGLESEFPSSENIVEAAAF